MRRAMLLGAMLLMAWWSLGSVAEAAPSTKKAAAKHAAAKKAYARQQATLRKSAARAHTRARRGHQGKGHGHGHGPGHGGHPGHGHGPGGGSPGHGHGHHGDERLRVLAINDFHGNLEPPTGSSGRIQTGPDPDGGGAQTAPTVDAGGANFLATHLNALRQGHEHNVFVGAGDLIGASPLISGIFHDEPTIEVMNEMGMAYAGVGNHEFDEGAAELIRMQFGGCHPTEGCFGGDGFLGAAYRYLAANVRLEGTDDTILPPYMIKRAGDIPVAYIGLTLEGTPAVVTAEGVEGLEFDDEAATVNRLVRELSDRAGVEAFVILIHEGGVQNPTNGFADVDGCANPSGAIFDIAPKIDDRVDALISAHTHQPYLCEADGKAITSAASFGRLITTLDFELDGRTGDVESVATDNHIVTRDVPENPGVKAIVDHYKAESEPLANRVVGRITAPLTRTAPDGDESALGSVIADGQLAATQAAGAQIAFMNPGGIRTDLTATANPEPVTFGEIFAVQPFANLLVTKTMTGAQLDALLEQQVFTGSTRFLQVSDGFTYDWSASAPQGSRVSNLQLDGSPVGATTEYRVTMNSFLADGGDGFTVFRDGTDPVIDDADDLAALEAYLQPTIAGTPLAPPADDRITKLP